MANPQKEDGYTPIANEILDEVLKRKWTQKQLKILLIIWRYSYGFSKKIANFSQMKEFELYGLTRIRATLEALEAANVLNVNWDRGSVRFLKDYTKWKIDIVPSFSDPNHSELLKYNIKKNRKSGGWKKYRREGAGRKPFDCQKINQTDLVGLTKDQSVDCQKINQLIDERSIKRSGKPNDSAGLDPLENNRKQEKAKTPAKKRGKKSDMTIDPDYMDEDSIYSDLVEYGVKKGTARFLAHNNNAKFILNSLESYKIWMDNQGKEDPAYLIGIIRRQGGKVNAT